MYYNINNQQLVDSLPTSITLDNGTIITGENLDNSILAEGGYYFVRSDNPPQPENTVEDVSQRVVNINKPYVDITRTWIPIPIVVPESISARQVRLWLIDNDISLTSVEAAIDTIVNEKLREKTRVEWEYAPYIERNHPLIESLGQYLGLSPEQIDQGFVIASQL
jgi:hypothetical protein